MKEQKEYSIPFAGRELTIRTGLLAEQANASCTVQFGDTVVLCAATMGPPREGMNFFPLAVDFEERMYAAGRIKGSRFMKREGRPTDEAVLSGRMIDRALRPLFPSKLRNEVAVVTTVFSHDQENDADIPGLIGASCALAMSNIPWNGPIAAVRVGLKDGELILMPTYEEISSGGFDLVVAGTHDKTVMVEAGANEVPEDQMLAALELSSKALGPIIDLINKVVAVHGSEKLDPLAPKDADEAEAQKQLEILRGIVFDRLAKERANMFTKPLVRKADRKDVVDQLQALIHSEAEVLGINEDLHRDAMNFAEDYIEIEVTRLILEEGKRVDGRGLFDVRPLNSIVSLMPRSHGTGLFERGATQVLSSVTLGSPGMQQTLDTMEFQTTKRFFHHYNFPSFSVGETKPNRGPGRREIGHGALAERALEPMIPSREDFPYTIRVVSEVLGSNGSSSMGATCGSTLALLDAGVPIKKPVAGIAMGLASDEKNKKYQVFTDLQDLEDGEGGMDFKIAGTREGITAMQMDTKTQGLPWEVVQETLAKARDARIHILDHIAAVIPEPRTEMSKYAPRITSFRINPDKIRDVIGPGGKIINSIIDEHGVEIDIEDDGMVMVTGNNADGAAKAVEWIKQLTREVEAGEIFEGKVTRVMDFGAFVEILPGTEGLVHVSEIANARTEKVTDVLNVGDTVKVIVYEIDDMKRLNLSIKRLDPDWKEKSATLRQDRDRSRGYEKSSGRPRGGRDQNRRPQSRS